MTMEQNQEHETVVRLQWECRKESYGLTPPRVGYYSVSIRLATPFSLVSCGRNKGLGLASADQ
jgi:hypothetical protein